MNFDVSTDSLGVRTGSYLPRTSPVEAVVVHTTGHGPWSRANLPKFAKWRAKWKVPKGDAFLAAVALYCHTMKAGPHTLVCLETGRTARLCPDGLCAWHVGAAGARPYQRAGWVYSEGPRFAWWRDEWPGLSSPVQLAGGRVWAPYAAPKGLSLGQTQARLLAAYAKGSANANTVSVESIPTQDGSTPTGRGLAALVEVVGELAEANRVQLVRDRLLSHSDIHPLNRTTSKGVAWDPRPNVMTAVREAFDLGSVHA